jgi:uncharacterized membrane protein YjgN (DUF898 family)
MDQGYKPQGHWHGHGAVPAPGQAPQPAPAWWPALTIQYCGTGGTLFVLVVKNLLLTLVTLGVYLPWARTERRKYLWQNLDVGGQRLRYHGTGTELFVGYLKVLAAYALFLGVPFGVSQIDKTAGLIVQGVAGVVLLLVVPFAIYGSRRYRLSRTSLRGIRFGQEPGSGGYFKKFVGGLLLTMVTLGFFTPVWKNRLYTYVTKRTRYGSVPFDYDGTDREAFLIGVKGFLLTMITFGIYGPWYMATVARFRASHTIFQGARGKLDVTGGELFQIFIIAYIGVAASLGIAFPWISTFVMRTLASKLTFVGVIDFAQIERQATQGDAAADGFADALDVGIQI